MRRMLALAVLLGLAATLGAADGVITVEKKDGRVRVDVDGDLFTEYIYDLDVQPVLHPVMGPGEVRMTRLWPLDDSDEREDRDHLHHRGVWMAFGNINGVDFWRAKDPQPKILHDALLEAAVENGVGVIQARNRWVDTEGRVQCTDTRTLHFSADEGARIIDYDVSLHASEGPFTLGVDEEGMMAIRTHPELRLEGPVAKGHAINSEGVRGKPIWGKRANWVDYWAPIDGKMVGVAIFDHPSNPRHPTWWHAREYGLITANPSGGHDTTGKTPPLRVEAGDSLSFRYRFVFHEGDYEKAEIARRYEEYAAAP
jgi:hypothetical protein